MVLAATMITSCGGSKSHGSSAGATSPAGGTHVGDAAVVRVGDSAISPAAYAHWLTIGEATVEKPSPTGPLPTRIAYQPPEFAACVASLRSRASASTSTASLRRQCERAYEDIRTRVLNFLITGYWLREEAAASHQTVSAADVHEKFQEQRQLNYPTPASFRRLQQASRQTVADLEFAVQTQLLSARLLARFAAATGREPSTQSTIAAFNSHIESTWIPRTNCANGYVIRDCRQYRK
jgi:hypothetical protein